MNKKHQETLLAWQIRQLDQKLFELDDNLDRDQVDKVRQDRDNKVKLLGNLRLQLYGRANNYD